MAPFKDDQIIIIAPGSQTTLAQMGLPESFTPAKLRLRSCMFPSLKEGQWEPYAITQKPLKPTTTTNNDQTSRADLGANGAVQPSVEIEEEYAYEEDRATEEGAVWPIENGQITNWSCFFAFLTHVCNSINLNASFYTPILLISQPSWTNADLERITEFFFEKFKVPAFTIMDAAVATLYAFGTPTATVVDVGKGKTDITAITDFAIHESGRSRSISDCGGDALTKQLYTLLQSKGFTMDMCEQLKRSPICEILPAGTPLPGLADGEKAFQANGAGPVSNNAPGSIAARKGSVADIGGVEDTGKSKEEDEGVLDVASIVTGGKMSEYLARREKEKADKAAAKKKGGESTQAQQRQFKLPNARREKNTFMYNDHALLTALKKMDLGEQGLADAHAALDETAQKALTSPDTAEGPGFPSNGQHDGAQGTTATSTSTSEAQSRRRGVIRREIEVGLERFQAADNGILERIADSIHRTISSVEEHSKRSDLWDFIIVVGNGSKLRGFKDALMTILQNKYLISPSSGTIFTSELPSNLSTPTGTGANTPQPQSGMPHVGGTGSNVNPLLLAATTAQNPHLNPPSTPQPQGHSSNAQSSHGQSPMSIKYGKVPDYFPEWKEVGYDEAMFLGGQVAAKVAFITDAAPTKSYMTRTDFNEQGPQGIHDYSLA
jgi:actin-related protein 9